MDTTAICGLLAEPERLRVYAAVVLGAESPEEAAAASGVTEKAAAKALQRLTAGRLVWSVDGRLEARTWVFKDAVREASLESPERYLDDPEKDAVVRGFVRKGRLQRLPAAKTRAQRAKLVTVLEFIARDFEPGVRYPEKDVNATLNQRFEDHAALRRYLVDYGFMAREDAVYWRSGGPVAIE